MSIFSFAFVCLVAASCTDAMRPALTSDGSGSLKPFDIRRINGRDVPSVESELIYLTRTPTLEWEAVEAASRYFIFIERVSDQREVCQDVSLSTSLELSGCFLEQGVVYRALVQAIGASNSSASSRRPQFVLDSVKPVVTWSQAMPAVISATDISWAFGATETGSGLQRFECRANSGNFGPCTSPWNGTALADGTHVLSIRAYDNAGNSSEVKIHSWVVDTTSPAAPTFSSPASDQSISATQYLFSWTTSDTGSGLPSSGAYQFDLYPLADCLGTATTHTRSISSFLASGLASGQTYSAQVRATDRAGNVSTSACSSDITMTGGPVSLSLSDQTSSSSTSSNSQTVNISISEPAGVSKWCVTENVPGPTDSAHCPGGQGPSSGWHLTRPTTFQLSAGDGIKSVRVWVADSGGQLLSTPGFASLSLDETPPTGAAILGILGSLDLVQDAWLVGTLSPTVRASTASDSGSGIFSYEIVIRDAMDSIDVCTAATSSVPEVPLSACLLIDGTSYVARGKVFDGAGNEAILSPFGFTVDRPLLGTFMVSGVTGGIDANVDAILASSTGGPQVHFSMASGATIYDVKILSGGTVLCQRLNQPALSPMDLTTSGCVFTQGQSYQVQIMAKSPSGQVGTPESVPFSFVYDSVVPGAFTITGVTGGADAMADTILSANSEPVVTFSSASGASSYQVQIRDGADSATVCERTVMSSPASFVTVPCGLAHLTNYRIRVLAQSPTGGNSTLATNAPFTFTKNTAFPIVNFQLSSSVAFDQSGPWSVPFSSWSRRLEITIDNSLYAETFTDFPVPVRLNPGRIDYGHLKSDGTDIRFTDSSDNVLPYEIESWNPTGESIIWVRIPSVAANSATTKFWLYYSNSGATDAQNSGQVWSDNYRAVYHMKTLNDSTSFARHAVSVHPAATIQGALGDANHFNGGPQAFWRLPVSAFDVGDSTYTMELFFRSTGSSQGLLSLVQNNGFPDTISNYTNFLYVDSSGRLRNGYYHSSVQTQQLQSVNNSQWQHVAHTLNGLQSAVLVNGVPAGTMTLAGAPNHAAATTFLIGSGFGASWPSLGSEWRPFFGQIDEVRISSVVRSQIYVSAQYRAMTTSNYLIFGSRELRGLVPVKLVVLLDRTPGADVDIPYSLSGSAQNPADHNLSPGVLTIPSGSASGEIAFQVFRNAGTPGDKTLLVQLGAPTGGLLGSGTQHTVTIKDNTEWPRFTGTAGVDTMGFSSLTNASPNLNLVFAGGGAVVSTSEYRIVEDVTNIGLTAWASIPVSQPFQVTGLSLTPGRTYILQARAVGGAGEVFGPYEVLRWTVSAPAVTLAFARQPTESYLIGTLNGGATVEIRDSFGRRVSSGPDANAPAVISLSSGAGSLLGTTVGNFVGGVLDLGALNLAFNADGEKRIRVLKQSTLGSGGTAAMMLDSNPFMVYGFPCDSGTWQTTCVLTSHRELPAGASISGNNLTLDAPAGGIRHNFNLVPFSMNLTGNLWLKESRSIYGNIDLTANEIRLDVYASISADSLGYLGGRTGSLNGSGPGGGIYRGIGSNYSGGGGGYGGRGSSGNLSGSNGGVTYGSATSIAVDYGSGGAAAWAGASHNGGNGGGRIRISANKLIMNHACYIRANGAGGGGAGGGGSGGGIYINIPDITEGWGDVQIQTIGGGGGGYLTDTGGSGGGGRIVIHSQRYMVPRPNYWGGSTNLVGEMGTLHYFASAGANAICDTGTVDTVCEVNKWKFIPHGTTLSGTGTLDIRGSAGLFNFFPLQSYSVLFPSGTIQLATYGGIHGNTTITASTLSMGNQTSISANSTGHAGAGYYNSFHPFGGTALDGKGPGGGISVYSGASIAGGAGSYGGRGSTSDVVGANSGTTYGSTTNPQDLGSGGGAGFLWWGGGSGGGKIDITATNLSLSGESFFQANGGNGGGHAGGGSGGTVRLKATNVSSDGWARVQAIGGHGSWWTSVSVPNGRFGGAGGGGRVLIDIPKAAALQPEVWGGLSGHKAGESGTFHVTWTSDLNNICDSGNWASTCTIDKLKWIPGGLNLSGNNLSFTAPAPGFYGAFFNHHPLAEVQINLTGNLTMTNSNNSIHMNLNPLTANQINLNGGRILASRLGHIGEGAYGAPFDTPTAGQGPGAGIGIYSPGLLSGGGGAHGSDGVAGGLAGTSGGTAYGSATNPVTYGSGGGSGDPSWAAGAGGGILKIVANSITGISEISSDGGDGGYSGGGGGGGSIHITANSVSGGAIYARGGAGGQGGWFSSNVGGPGGGGRVAIFTERPPNTRVEVFGGRGLGGRPTAFKGSYHLNASLGVDAICDSGSLATTCTVSNGYHLPDGYSISGSGHLVVSGNGCLVNQLPKETLSINMSGSVTLSNSCGVVANVNITTPSLVIQSGSQIDASGLGYVGGSDFGSAAGSPAPRTGEGPGGGNHVSSDPGAGGSYGGTGGNDSSGATGGATYGNATNPTDFGSGGGIGSYQGGRGGGAIFITATTITNNGSIRADGAGGGWAGGGGSGGTVNISSGTISGSGTISVRGGNGGNWNGSQGGAGGGGRIRVGRSGGVPWPVGQTLVSGGTATFPALPGSAGTTSLP